MGQAKKKGTLDQRIQQAQQQQPSIEQQRREVMTSFEVMAPGFGELVPDRDIGTDLQTKIAKHMPRFRNLQHSNGDIVHYAGFSTPEIGEDKTRAHWFATIIDKAHYSGPKFQQLQTMERHTGQQRPVVGDINAIAEIQWMPVYTTKHALERWQQRTHLDAQEGIPSSAEYFTCRSFQEEFRLRGAPKQRHWGCPVEDGIFLGEWMTRQEMHSLEIGFEKAMGTQSFVAWQHDCHSHLYTTDQRVMRNPVAQNVLISTYKREPDEWFFLAKTFISYRDASFGQASLAMSYDKDPGTTAQQFRRAGAEEWLDHTKPSVLTTKAKEMGILQ